MDNELIATIVAVLLAAAGWLKSHSEVEGVKKDRETTKMEGKICQPNPHNGANCTDLSSGKIEWNYHFGIN